MRRTEAEKLQSTDDNVSNGMHMVQIRLVEVEIWGQQCLPFKRRVICDTVKYATREICGTEICDTEVSITTKYRRQRFQRYAYDANPTGRSRDMGTAMFAIQEEGDM